MLRTVPAASPKAMLLSAERPNRGSLCTWGFKGHAVALNWSGANSPAGVGLEHVQTDMRFPRNLGDPVASSATSGWRYRITNSRPWRRTRPSRSESNECNRGIAKRRKRSAAKWVTGSHSVLILPLKLANFTPLEPVEGSETSNHGTVFGKHGECLEIRQTCTRNRDG